MHSAQPDLELLVSGAKARAVALACSNEMALDDALFVLRALYDLETDGVEVFDRQTRTGAELQRNVEAYIAARVGASLAQTLALTTDSNRRRYA